MAFSSSSPILVFILLTTFLFINASATTRFGMEATRLNLNEICSHTPNPSFCMTALNSDPRTANADLHGLIAISIDLADAAVKRTSELIRSLTARTSAVELKQRYELCANYYGHAMTDFGMARLELAKGELQSLGSHAMDAVEQVQNCQDEFEVPPPDPSTLRQKNKIDVDLSSMVFVIAGRLAS